jgi:hypothetical protein
MILAGATAVPAQTRLRVSQASRARHLDASTPIDLRDGCLSMAREPHVDAFCSTTTENREFDHCCAQDSEDGE